MNYWLLKTEPNAYSIADMQRDGVTEWDGVRNYQARNYMRDSMKPGDLALFYHSGDEKAVVGVVEIATAAHPDESAFDPSDHHFDPKSSRENPTWMCPDMRYKETFRKPVSLKEIKTNPDLIGIVLAQQGSRLSIQPVSKEHFEVICRMGEN